MMLCWGNSEARQSVISPRVSDGQGRGASADPGVPGGATRTAGGARERESRGGEWQVEKRRTPTSLPS
eukprot:9484110-Pyramimonas_sp.AAC.1